MNKFISLILIAVVVVAGILWGLQKYGKNALPGEKEVGNLPLSGETIVHYTDSGFTPSPLVIAVGQTVTFINESSGQMWIASAFHPTHQALPGFDQLEGVGANQSYQYTFTKAGEWKYHNHLNSKDFGAVIAK